MRQVIRYGRTGGWPALAAFLLLSGCATPPPKSDPEALADFKATNDPLEPTNRVVFKVENGLLTYVLTPIARGYNYVLPAPVRGGIHNVLNNFGAPVQLANDVLETRPRRAGDTFVRFVLNTSVGIGGVFDVAKHVGYPDHSNDGGVTLAMWGIPSGPYLYLPVFGPSGVRDGIGRGLDSAVSPYTWATFNGVNHLNAIETGLSAVDTIAPHIDDLKKLNADALDPYATQRSLYRQLRQNEIDAARNDRRATVPDWYPQAPATNPAKPPPTGNGGRTPLPLPTVSPAVTAP